MKLNRLRMIKSNLIKNLLYITTHYFIRTIYYPLMFLPIKKDTVLVSNYVNKGWGDNPKYVIEELLKSSDITIKWLVEKNNCEFTNTDIISIKYPSIKALIALATSKIWISNTRMPLFLKKRDNQKYIQLWHGGCGPKKIEQQAIDKLSYFYICRARNDSKMIDYTISNSDFNTKIFKHHFWYSGAILSYGSPRHDAFYKKSNELVYLKKRICNKYGILEDKKIILYAPTFRKDKDISTYSWDYHYLTTIIEKRFQTEYSFLIKLHPNISFLSGEFSDSQNVVDVSGFNDAQELISISDIIITDYSGIMMQGALAKKLVILYTPDFNAYKDERGFNINIEETPFIKLTSIENLENSLAIFDINKYYDNLNAFLLSFKFCDDGNASRRVAKLITNLMEDKDEKI